MYTQEKIKKLGKNNVVTIYDDFELIECYDYCGILSATIFKNKFTKTCLRNKEWFNKKVKTGIKFPIYIIKNNDYYRQFEEYENSCYIFDESNQVKEIDFKLPFKLYTLLKHSISLFNNSNSKLKFIFEEKIKYKLVEENNGIKNLKE